MKIDGISPTENFLIYLKKDNSVQLKFAMEDNSQKPAVQKTETPAPIPQAEKQYDNSYSYQTPAPTLKTVESRSITPEEKEKLSGSDDMFLASLEQPAKKETAVTAISGPEPKPHKVTVEEINKAISEIPLPEEPEEQSGEAFKFIDAQSFTKKSLCQSLSKRKSLKSRSLLWWASFSRPMLWHRWGTK